VLRLKQIEIMNEKKSLTHLKNIKMGKKTITITASAAIINAISFILAPASTQKILSESFYLASLRETVTICLS
jgi:hypothetical protein